jgi:hypothetical protein
MSLSKLLVDVPNPFSEGIVGDPWDFDPARTPDIETIHANAFGVCLRLLSQDVRRNGQSALLIDGPAGSGKTHLIARLVRRLQAGRPPGLPCYVSLDDVLPQRVWSHLRQRVAGDLLTHAGTDGRTGLERLLENRLPGLLAGVAPRGDDSLLDWVRRVFTPPRRAQVCARLRQELFEQVRLDREVRATLLILFGDDAEQAQLARDWLTGTRLTDEQLTRLGLPPGDLPDQVVEHQSRAVVLSLLRLAGEALPVVLCFDQIEHLIHTLEDRAGFIRFGQVVAKIRHEGGKGLLLVSFVLSDQVRNLKDAVGAADWARIAENRAGLSPLTWAEAHRLILQRMEAVEPLRALRRGQADEYWPLDKQRLLEIYQRLRLTCTPRELLWECKRAFGDSDLPPPPEEYLLAKWQQKCQQKQQAPSGDRLLHALNGVPWLAVLLGTRYQKIEVTDLPEFLPDANLFLQAPDGGRIAFSSCPRTPHLWRRFDRLSRDWQSLPPKLNCDRLVLLCDCPPGELTPGTQIRLQTMVKKLRGVVAVCPPRERLIALDGLHSLLTDAQKGALVYEGRDMRAKEVDDWARAGVSAPGHELGVLRELFDELGLDLPTSPAPGPGRGQAALAGNG